MRKVPWLLQQHLNGAVTTCCYLLKITTKDGRIFGATSLDQSLIYDGVRYGASNGLDVSTIITDAKLSANNGEAKILTAKAGGLTLNMAINGHLDDATWLLMLVNWVDLKQGHIIIDGGDIGEVKAIDNVLIVCELVSFSMRLQQAIGDTWQRDCRAIFGTPNNNVRGCGVNANNLFKNGVVSSVNLLDIYRSFSTDLSGDISGGRLQWLSGDNASLRLNQVNLSGGFVRFSEAQIFPIKQGDTFKIRPDCAKNLNACKAYNNVINYKGEPFIPVEQGAQIQQPGAEYLPPKVLI